MIRENIPSEEFRINPKRLVPPLLESRTKLLFKFDEAHYTLFTKKVKGLFTVVVRGGGSGV